MQEVHPQPENHLHARYPTDAPEPASVPGAAPAEIWARLAPGAYTRRWVFFRQALRSALLGICALPGRRAARRLLWAAGFALLLGGLAGAMGMILTGTDAALLPACLGSFAGYLLVLAGLTGTRSAWRIRRQLRRFGGAVLTPTHLHWKDSYGVRDLPLADLALVQRFPGWTVLVWKKDKLQALPLPDAACPMGGEALFYRLRQAAPRAVCRLSHRRLRPRWGFVFCLLAAAGLLFLNSQFLGMVGQGFQLIQIPDSASGAHIALAYNRHTGQFSLPGQAPFPYPAVGDLKLQWQSDACCAVTYQTTDGSIRVELLDGTDGQAPRLDPDPPTGRWQQYLELSDAGITLRWDEEGQCYHLFTQDGESVYHQWQQFDGLGLALCDDRGLPQWTLTPDTRPLPNTDSDGPVLLLCPVTLDKNGLCIPLYACTAPAASETDTAPPVFTDTIDVCVNENGVFFTWDDGISVQQALTAAQCQYYGIESEADLEPLVLRWDVAAFLTRADGQAWAYTTTDQGQTWQAASLTEGTSQAEVTDLCLSFTGRGLGFAAVSTQDRESGEIQVGIYTSADGGVSWSAVNTPAPQNDSLRPLNGLIFYDGAAGLASMESGSGSPWPHVFATEDCGQTWEEVAMPFADSGQTSATRLVEFFFDEYDWVAIFTQEPAAPREITFKGSMPSGPWTYAATHASN